MNSAGPLRLLAPQRCEITSHSVWNKEMPKSKQRTGLFPRVSGACRKENIARIDDLERRKEIGLNRILGLFDKAKQLSLFTDYNVSVIVQPPEGELTTMMFATNDDLFANMAALVRRFGPRGEAGGACTVPSLPKNRLANFLKVAPQPGVVIPQGHIAMVSSKPMLKKQQQHHHHQPQQQMGDSVSPQYSSGFGQLSDEQLQLSPPFDSDDNIDFLGFFERAGWRVPDLDYGLMSVPPTMLRNLTKHREFNSGA